MKDDRKPLGYKNGRLLYVSYALLAQVGELKVRAALGIVLSPSAIQLSTSLNARSK